MKKGEGFLLGSKKEGKYVLLVKYEGGERFPPSEVGRRGNVSFGQSMKVRKDFLLAKYEAGERFPPGEV
jgi:hypothetical protein